MNDQLLEQVSFTLDLLNLERKLSGKDTSDDHEASSSVYVVEETLRGKGVRAPINRNAK